MTAGLFFCNGKKQNKKSERKRKDSGEGRFFNTGKEKGGFKKKGSKKDEGVLKSGSVRSDPKMESF